MFIVTHRKGKRLANFWLTLLCLWKSFFAKRITLVFTEESKYEIYNQYKWNKIIGRRGLFYDFSYKVHKNFTTLAWRYNKDLNLFQVAEYTRKDYEASYKVVGNLLTNQKGTFKCNFKGVIPLAFRFSGIEKPTKNISYLIKFN